MDTQFLADSELAAPTAACEMQQWLTALGRYMEVRRRTCFGILMKHYV
jgi:hypothetical protein